MSLNIAIWSFALHSQCHQVRESYISICHNFFCIARICCSDSHIEVYRQFLHPIQTENNPIKNSIALMIDGRDCREVLTFRNPHFSLDCMGEVLAQAQRELIPFQAKVPDWPCAGLVEQCRIIAGIWFSRKAVIAEADGDSPSVAPGIVYLYRILIKVRKLVELFMVREWWPALLLKIWPAHRVAVIRVFQTMVYVSGSPCNRYWRS